MNHGCIVNRLIQDDIHDMLLCGHVLKLRTSHIQKNKTKNFFNFLLLIFIIFNYKNKNTEKLVLSYNKYHRLSLLSFNGLLFWFVFQTV